MSTIYIYAYIDFFWGQIDDSVCLFIIFGFAAWIFRSSMFFFLREKLARGKKAAKIWYSRIRVQYWWIYYYCYYYDNNNNYYFFYQYYFNYVIIIMIIIIIIVIIIIFFNNFIIIALILLQRILFFFSYYHESGHSMAWHFYLASSSHSSIEWNVLLEYITWIEVRQFLRRYIHRFIYDSVRYLFLFCIILRVKKWMRWQSSMSLIEMIAYFHFWIMEVCSDLLVPQFQYT